MRDSNVREQTDRPRRARRPAFDLLPSKLHPPTGRTGSIGRAPLIERLVRDDSCPVVLVAAPAGYGKTTLLSQWAENDGRAFAWVSVGEQDNDPKVLLAYVAEALDAVEPVGDRVFDALASPRSSVPGSVIPRLSSAFWSMTAPVVLVLDDVHVLRNPECRAALSVLTDHVPAGSRLVLAGRDQPPLPTARLRAEGKILEIGPRDLSFTRAEVALLLRNTGLALGEKDIAALYQRTEGWPAGLYLAALCLRQGSSVESAAISFRGDERLVSEYVESEFLARISREEREFLTRTAVLERMCGSLCAAVLEMDGSAGTLTQLARSNLLLVPLDQRGEWYRYHHLFRDTLLAELHRQAPDLIPLLRRRAADWCQHNGLPEEAMEYCMAAGDVDTVAWLVERFGVRTYQQGRGTTLQRWLGWLDDRGAIDRRPMVAVLASIIYALTARPVEAERWADAADRWEHGNPARPDDPSAEAWAAVLRALLCRHGVDQMRADADEAVRGSATDRSMAPPAVLFQGIARVLSGDLDGGDTAFQDAVSAGEQVGALESVVAALCERSLLAMNRSDWSQAESLAEQASTAARGAGYEDALLSAVQARAALHRGDVPSVRRVLVDAQRLRPLVTYAMPHLAVQVRNELARVHLALADLAGARALMREVDEVLRRRPGLGTLAEEAQALRAQLAGQRGASSPGASALTAAELRLLPLLSTHLSFPEIGQELFVSRHTVKSQANSIYRKLDASSRNQAVTRARQLGLLEG